MFLIKLVSACTVAALVAAALWFYVPWLIPFFVLATVVIAYVAITEE